jgi:hypothetical protein
MNLKSFGLTVALSLTLGACATGRTHPTVLISQAQRAYDAEDYYTVLSRLETVLAVAPHILGNWKHVDDIVLYRDSQIRYAMANAEYAEEIGDLSHAWVWYVQASKVDPDREECRLAEIEATRLKQAISDSYARQAASSLGRNDFHAAIVEASQSLAFGENPQALDVLSRASESGSNPGADLLFENISEDDVTDLVRTDSLARLRPRNSYSPYGIPVYFGDIRRYYTSFGTVEIITEAPPHTSKSPSGWELDDAILGLTNRALASGADAIINVRYRTRNGRKFYTEGELVKFGSF